MSTFTDTVSNKPPIQLLPLVNENKKTTLLLLVAWIDLALTYLIMSLKLFTHITTTGL